MALDNIESAPYFASLKNFTRQQLLNIAELALYVDRTGDDSFGGLADHPGREGFTDELLHQIAGSDGETPAGGDRVVRFSLIRTIFDLIETLNYADAPKKTLGGDGEQG